MNDISVLETVIENVPVGVMITDHEGVILTINQRHPTNLDYLLF